MQEDDTEVSEGWPGQGFQFCSVQRTSTPPDPNQTFSLSQSGSPFTTHVQGRPAVLQRVPPSPPVLPEVSLNCELAYRKPGF